MEITEYQWLTAHEIYEPWGKVSKPPFTKVPGSAVWRLQNRPARLDRLEPYSSSRIPVDFQERSRQRGPLDRTERSKQIVKVGVNYKFW